MPEVKDKPKVVFDKEKGTIEGDLFRVFAVEDKQREAIDKEARTVEMTFSSEDKLVERFFGEEQMVHTKEAADLKRLNDGGALLLDHDRTKQIGVIEKAFIDTKEKKGRAIVRFSKSSLGEEVFGDVVDGIRKNVSIYFRATKAEITERKGKVDLIRILEWEAFEISFVSIPADETVGVGRAEEIIKPKIEERKEETMPEPEKKTEIKVDIKGLRAEVQKAERERVANINKVVATFPGETIRKMADEAIKEGTDSGEFYGRALVELGKAKEIDADAGPEASEAHLGMDKRDVERYSIRKALAGMLEGQTLDGVELEAHKELTKRFGESSRGGLYIPVDAQMKGAPIKRTQTVAPGSAGGYLIGTENMSLIDLLRNNTLVNTLGVQTMSGLVGNVTIPKQTGASSLFWIADDEATTTSDLTFGQLSMTPHTASAATPMSRQLLLQSDPSIDGIVQGDLARTIAIGVDLAVLNGSGTNGEPRGLLNTSGVGTQTTSTVTWAQMVGFESTVATANALLGSVSFLTTPAVRGSLKTVKKDAGSGIFLMEGTEVNGYRLDATTQMPANNILFGDWSTVVIGEWGVLELRTVDQGTNYRKGEVEILAFKSMDVAVRQPTAFVKSTDFAV